jgi:hypothetical protein
MASAIVRAPNRNGPPDLVRHCVQISDIRRMSASALVHILNPGKCPLRLTGNDDRNTEKPE